MSSLVKTPDYAILIFQKSAKFSKSATSVVHFVYHLPCLYMAVKI